MKILKKLWKAWLKKTRSSAHKTMLRESNRFSRPYFNSTSRLLKTKLKRMRMNSRLLTTNWKLLSTAIRSSCCLGLTKTKSWKWSKKPSICSSRSRSTWRTSQTTSSLFTCRKSFGQQAKKTSSCFSWSISRLPSASTKRRQTRTWILRVQTELLSRLERHKRPSQGLTEPNKIMGMTSMKKKRR